MKLVLKVVVIGGCWFSRGNFSLSLSASARSRLFIEHLSHSDGPALFWNEEDDVGAEGKAAADLRDEGLAAGLLRLCSRQNIRAQMWAEMI